MTTTKRPRKRRASGSPASHGADALERIEDKLGAVLDMTNATENAVESIGDRLAALETRLGTPATSSVPTGPKNAVVVRYVKDPKAGPTIEYLTVKGEWDRDVDKAHETTLGEARSDARKHLDSEVSVMTNMGRDDERTHFIAGALRYDGKREPSDT